MDNKNSVGKNMSEIQPRNIEWDDKLGFSLSHNDIGSSVNAN